MPFPVTQLATKQATNVLSHPVLGRPIPPRGTEPISLFQHQLHRTVWWPGPASLNMYNPQTCGVPQPSPSVPFYPNPLLLALCSLSIPASRTFHWGPLASTKSNTGWSPDLLKSALDFCTGSPNF